MLLGTLMAAYGAPDPNYTGILTNDDNVLAIDISDTQDAPFDQFAVVQGAITGVDAQLNPAGQDKIYLRAGQSTTKTSTQRAFKATGDRYIGDDFQDYACARKRLYGVGQVVVARYVWFCMLNGKGETGLISIMVNSDGSGEAGNTAGIDIDLKKTGPLPEDYVYTPAGALGVLTVLSAAGAETGKTRIAVSPDVMAGLVAKYTTAPSVGLPSYDGEVASWQPFPGDGEYDATAGDEFAIAYVDTEGKAKYAGKTIAVVA